jgi:hypothetical protein
MFILNYIEDHRWTWIPFVAAIKLMEFFADKIVYPEGIIDLESRSDLFFGSE